MKILHICSYFFKTKLYEKLFNAIALSDEQQVVYGFSSKKEKISPDLPFVVCADCCFSKLDRVIFSVKHRKVLGSIQRNLNCTEFDIAHAHSLFSNGYIAYKLKEIYGIPYIVAVRNTDVNLFFRRMIHLRKLGIDILQNAEKIVFLSESYRKQVIENFIPMEMQTCILNKSLVIANGIDEFWLNNRYWREKQPTDKVKVIYVGSLDRNKNLEMTIRACRLLQQRGTAIHLTAVGRIVSSYYDRLIKKNADIVTHIEYSPKEKIIDFFREADIFVMPSKTETFGLVYAEAMTQGLPIIYTRGQGFDGQFPDGEVGFSVDSGNAMEIANSILKIVDDYLAFSHRCYSDVAKFNWEIIANEYIEIYKSIVVDGK